MIEHFDSYFPEKSWVCFNLNLLKLYSIGIEDPGKIGRVQRCQTDSGHPLFNEESESGAQEFSSIFFKYDYFCRDQSVAHWNCDTWVLIKCLFSCIRLKHMECERMFSLHFSPSCVPFQRWKEKGITLYWLTISISLSVSISFFLFHFSWHLRLLYILHCLCPLLVYYEKYFCRLENLFSSIFLTAHQEIRKKLFSNFRSSLPVDSIPSTLAAYLIILRWQSLPPLVFVLCLRVCSKNFL